MDDPILNDVGDDDGSNVLTPMYIHDFFVSKGVLIQRKIHVYEYVIFL